MSRIYKKYLGMQLLNTSLRQELQLFPQWSCLKIKYFFEACKAKNVNTRFFLGTFHESKETKGLDIVRRDWCQLAKDAGKYVKFRFYVEQ